MVDLEGDGPSRFVAVRCPTGEELTTILTRFIRRAAKVLTRFDDEAETKADASSSTPGKPPGKRTCRVPWADLLKKVFAVDVLACPSGAGFGSSPSSPRRPWRGAS